MLQVQFSDKYSLRSDPIIKISVTKITLILLIGSIFEGGFENLIYANRPTAFTNAVQPIESVDQFIPDPIDLQSIRLEDELNDQEGGPYRFAIPRRVSITPADNGTWEEIDADTLLWRIRIISPEATSISLGFSRYSMPAGSSLVIYSIDGTQAIGPYTAHDNSEHHQLWTPLIHSSNIVVELTLPAIEVENFELTLETINHGYRSMLSPSMEKDLGDSDWCEVNVACPEGDNWRDQIRSVAHYHVTLMYGTYSCTGALINNTAQDERPYFLTAFHCFDEFEEGFIYDPSSYAASMVVYWNFQASTCTGITAPENQYQSGAYFRAAYCPSDFSLVELDEVPSSAFNVYYAGWDRNNTAPTSGVAIHHPAGDMKKISVENHPLSIVSVAAGACTYTSHLKVSHWEVGTTETGSSGCPFFNSNKRVVGQLHGGSADCYGGYDLFGRLYSSWTGGGTNSTRLSNWLDPILTGQTALDGKNSTSFYCSASGGCDEYISRVEVGDIDNSSNCNEYADYTAISTIMQIGQSYGITVTNGNPYSVDQCGIWVDWNQDCDFDDPGETIDVIGTPGSGPYTATITVPADAVLGDTRMRIRITYTGDVNPCGNTSYGEVEDYMITIDGEAAFDLEDTFPSTTIDVTKWTVVNDATIDDVGIDEPSPDYSLRLNGHPAGGDSVESRIIDLSSCSSPILSYYYERTGGGDSTENGDDLIFEYWNGLDWVELDRQLGSGPVMNSYELQSIHLPSQALHTGFRLRIRSIGTASSTSVFDDWFVDDVRIECEHGCALDAPLLHTEPNITPGLCNMISWDAVSEAEEYYAECSTDPSFTVVDGYSDWITSTHYEFCDLISGQEYWYRVKAKTSGSINSWLQTSQAEFGTGTLIDTLATSGGDVVLIGGSTSLFKDDFEDGDMVGWMAGSGSYTREVTNATAAAGSLYSITLIGGSNSHYDGVSNDLSALTPDDITFYVRSSDTSTSDGYFVVGTGSGSTQTAVFFYTKNDGQMGVYDGTTFWGTSYTSLTWYKIRFAFNWLSKEIDYYVNDILVKSGITFRSTSVSSLTKVYLYNFFNSQAWWDQIEFSSGSSGYISPGTIISEQIELPVEGDWGDINFSKTTPANTSLTVDVLDASDESVILTDVASGTDMSGITATSIKLRSNLATSDSAVTPALHDWSVTYTDPAEACESDWSNVESSRQCGTPGDFEPDCDVDLIDFTVLTRQWLQIPDTPSADIAPQPDGDGIVNILDLVEFIVHWLEGSE